MLSSLDASLGMCKKFIDCCLKIKYVWNGARLKLYSRFLYLRFIGDRSIDEKEFGTIQKDREAEMKKRVLLSKKSKMKSDIVAANNPRRIFGMEEIT